MHLVAIQVLYYFTKFYCNRLVIVEDIEDSNPKRVIFEKWCMWYSVLYCKLFALRHRIYSRV